MIEAGFIDVVEKQYLSPVNGWPADPVDKNIGNWCKFFNFKSYVIIINLVSST